MKKNVLFSFLTLLVLFARVLCAQEAEIKPEFTPELTLGVKGGASYSFVNFDPAISQELTPGIIGGVVLKYRERARLGIQTEFNFVQKGWTEIIRLDEATFKRSLNYLEVPLLTQITLGKRKSTICLNFGPSVSFLLSNRDSIRIVNENHRFSYYQKKIDSALDFGLALGLGFARKTGIGTFQLEGRFTYGFNNIISANQRVGLANNQNLSVTLAYLVPFRKKVPAKSPDK